MKKQILIAGLVLSMCMPSFALADSSFSGVKYGQRNNAKVKLLQTYLKEQGVYKGAITGNFLTVTRTAVKLLQKKLNIKQTGVVDELTLETIEGTEDAEAEETTTSTIHSDTSINLTKLPLGDNKYTTTTPKVGYILVCHVDNSQAGAFKDGPWITSTTWDATKKTYVQGDVHWSNALYSIKTEGANRVFTGNSLPINHNTGTYPISSSDAAYNYDRNPNSIKESSYTITVPLSPTKLTTPDCISGMVGVATSGVTIFNGFDAGMRDAVAHEVQDKCDGHPQEKGQYHYHNISRCLKDTRSQPGKQSDIMGYAFDGYPILGPYDENGKELTTQDLDECHGRTSTITVDGKTASGYHYVATKDFPYTVSCFKAKSYEPKPSGGGQSGQQQMQGSSQSGYPQMPPPMGSGPLPR